MPEHEQQKDFNLLLASLSSPYPPNPFSLQQGVHQDQGCKADPGKESLLYLHSQEFSFGHLEPDKNQLLAAPRILMCEEKPPPSLSLLSSNHFPSQPGR